MYKTDEVRRVILLVGGSLSPQVLDLPNAFNVSTLPASVILDFAQRGGRQKKCSLTIGFPWPLL